MTQLKNPIEIIKILDKSNCRECGEATCLAFAAAVFNGRRQLDECPRLDNGVIEHTAAATDPRFTVLTGSLIYDANGLAQVADVWLDSLQDYRTCSR